MNKSPAFRAQFLQSAGRRGSGCPHNAARVANQGSQFEHLNRYAWADFLESTVERARVCDRGLSAYRAPGRYVLIDHVVATRDRVMGGEFFPVHALEALRQILRFFSASPDVHIAMLFGF
ncbi:hypothetical protein [Burkholderia territorii]|uniref:hypothetical protein n=1 Tax=Burkholderia territorii TaxID=1503055 RepID=UPI0012D862A0|nr:hypothetical protein [Burkholderia territorii]